MDINEVLQVYKIAIIGLVILIFTTSMILAHMIDCLRMRVKKLEETLFR